MSASAVISRRKSLSSCSRGRRPASRKATPLHCPPRSSAIIRPGLLLGAAPARHVHAERAVPAAHHGDAFLDMLDFRFPDQRAVGEQPKRCATGRSCERLVVQYRAIVAVGQMRCPGNGPASSTSRWQRATSSGVSDMTRLVIAMAPLTSASGYPAFRDTQAGCRTGIDKCHAGVSAGAATGAGPWNQARRERSLPRPAPCRADAADQRLSGPGGVSARPRRDLVQALAHGLPRGRHRPAAGLQGHSPSARRKCWSCCATRPVCLRAFHNTCRHRGSQLCQAESGPAEGAAHHLSLSRMVLFAAWRSRPRAVEIPAGRFFERPTIRSTRRAVGVARLRLRQSR